MRRSRAASTQRPAFRSSSTATCCATIAANRRSSPAAPSSRSGCSARRLDLTDADIRHDLELGKGPALVDSRVCTCRVFALADRLSGKAVPRAVVPQIPLHSPKITRNLTSDWFAQRVEGRYRTCLARMGT